jgi:hypothetical protein
LTKKVRDVQKTKEWRHNNNARTKEYSHRFYNDNKEKVIKANGAYAKVRKRTDIGYRLATVLRSRLNKLLRGKVKIGSHVKDLGCSLKELRTYLESKFSSGMSWENYGMHGWHVDHILPLSSFDLTRPEELKLAVHYTNLQPLWAIDNLKKGKIIEL